MPEKAWKRARRRARLAVNVRASIDAACPKWRKACARIGLPGPAQRWTVRYCQRHEQAIRARIAKRVSHYTMRPYDHSTM
jgi:hypothetical protein